MKRMSSAILAFVMLLFVFPALAQNPDAPTVYAESFRQGSTQITEDSFDARLTPGNPTYRETIKDSNGSDRYSLDITPQGPEGDTRITSWRVTLRDLKHSIYPNILLTSVQGSGEDKDNLWWLNPNHFGGVPIRAKRIMKVDNFYVMIQVKDLHFTPLDSPYLDSMVVHLALTNSDPRNVKP